MTAPETPWEVVFSPGADRALQRLPHKVATAVAAFVVTTLPTDPDRLSKPLRYEFEGWRVARRGHYRVTFRIRDDTAVLYIGRIEHRAHVYRRQ